MADTAITPNMYQHGYGSNLGPGFGQSTVAYGQPAMAGDLYGAGLHTAGVPNTGFSAMMPPPNPELLLHGLASGGRAGLAGGHSMDAYGNPIATPQALGGSAMAMGGQAVQQQQQEPTTLLGKFKKKFYDLQTYIFLPGLLLIPAGFIGSKSAGGSLLARATNGVGSQGLTGWKKMMYPVAKFVNTYDQKMWSWGGKVGNFVKNKLGLKAKPGGFVHKLYTGGFNLSGNANSKWGKVLGFLKAAGQPVRNAAPAVANAAGKIVTKFSLRSVLTGLGFAGPLGYITGALALGWTLFSVGKKLLGGGNQQAQIAQQQQMMAMQGGNPYGQIGYGADTFGTNPMAMNAAGLPSIPSPMDAYGSLNTGMAGLGTGTTDPYGGLGMTNPMTSPYTAPLY